MNEPNRKPGQSLGKDYTQSRVSGLLQVGAGNMLASTVLAGLAVGFGLDYFLGTAPIFMLVCGGLGFYSGFRKASRLMQRQGQQAEESQERSE